MLIALALFTDIDPPEGLDSLRNRSLNLLFIPDVTPDSQCGAASGLHVGPWLRSLVFVLGDRVLLRQYLH